MANNKNFSNGIRVNDKSRAIEITTYAAALITRDLECDIAKRVSALKEMFGYPVRIVKEGKKAAPAIMKMTNDDIHEYVLKTSNSESEQYKNFKVLTDANCSHAEICQWFAATYPEYNKIDRAEADEILKVAKKAIQERRDNERKEKENAKQAEIVKLEEKYAA